MGNISTSEKALILLASTVTGSTTTVQVAQARYRDYLVDEYARSLEKADPGYRVSVQESYVDKIERKGMEGYQQYEARLEELRRRPYGGGGNYGQIMYARVAEEADRLYAERISEGMLPEKRKLMNEQFKAIRDAHRFQLKSMNAPFTWDEVLSRGKTLRAYRDNTTAIIHTLKMMSPKDRSRHLAEAMVSGEIKITNAFEAQVKKAIELRRVERMSLDEARLRAGVKATVKGFKTGALAAASIGVGYILYRSYFDDADDVKAKTAALAEEIDQDCSNSAAKSKADDYLNNTAPVAK